MSEPQSPPPTTSADFERGPGRPTPPIAIEGGATTAPVHQAPPLDGPGSQPASLRQSGLLHQPLREPAPLSQDLLDQLAATGADTTVDAEACGEASRDWWPRAMGWATQGELPGRAQVVVRPRDVNQVSEILSTCNSAGVPVTAAGGRSGVLGGSVPVMGGVVLDMCGLSGIVAVDNESLTVDVLAGTFGDALEAELRDNHGLTCGHWPQSMTLATVGGWVACRGAGQFSTRYGKIEDMVVGLTVVLADGTVVETGGNPRAAMGPDLNQLFIGSEGTLGVVTSVRLRVHPAPPATLKAGYSAPDFATGLDFFRRVLRSGATPAVLRLYDGTESDRNYSTGTERCAIAVLDEGDPTIVAATMAIVEREAAATEEMVELGEWLGESLVDHWLAKRNDVSQLEPLIQGGIVVDTMEVSGPWSTLAHAYESAVAAMQAVPGCLMASAHCSHSYLDGACLYFTFAGRSEEDSQAARDALHGTIWDEGQKALLAAGTSVSHHHGIGIHRGPYLRESLGSAHGVLADIKAALDPNGILNPTKLGLGR